MLEDTKSKEPSITPGERSKKLLSDFTATQQQLAIQRCPVCNNLDVDTHKSTSFGQLRLEYEEISWGRDKDCTFCTFLCTVAKKHAEDVLDCIAENPLIALYFVMQYSDRGSLKLHLESYNPDSPRSFSTPHRIEIYCPKEESLPFWPQLRTTPSLSTHSSSTECFRFLEDRLEICASEHYDCNPVLPVVFPRRLLDIGLAVDDSIKLSESHSFAAEDRYIALSHCWGGSDIPKTTSANFSEMMEKIRWNSLPRTFRDVITVARRLGVRWLWIDSLCIIQGDKADWETESAVMGQYYANTYLTVAASLSPNPMTPFLCERGPWSLAETFEICHGGRKHSVMAHPRPEDRFTPTQSSTTAINHRFGPLSTRAWTWQENALASRIVHYTATGLVYECRGEETVHTEDYLNLPIDRVASLPWQIAQRHAIPGTQWQKAVKTYSGRSLTFQTDKLPGISGYAREFDGGFGSQYLAGLWSRNLVEDLFWSASRWSNGASEAQPPSVVENGSPSWSWASVTGDITFRCPELPEDSHVGKALISIHAAETTLCGLNPFGQVSSGFITLTGSLLYLKFRNVIQDSSHMKYIVEICHQSVPNQIINMIPDAFLENCKVETHTGVVTSFRRSKLEGKPDLNHCGTIDGSSVILHCLMVYEVKGSEFSDGLHGLVLVPSEEIKGAYTRIGYFSGRDEVWKDLPREEKRITIV
ncbi:heterokaryon incompatibility protein-domain-containing protein [Rhexocercosporidium sp. MPI-PUGE-AT-0058]|nr:heterokaryon incompatibility protein-domain-containing protein [Rhexocercosporidium sp. MPI-PUGE-AT-0058]